MKKLIILTVLLLLIGGGLIGYSVLSDSSNEEDSPEQDQITKVEREIIDQEDEVTVESEAEVVESFSEASVAQHATRSDCWTTVDGNVYDISKLIESTPGGDELIAACGTDGTELFDQRPDSQELKQELDQYLQGSYSGASE